MYGNGRCLDGIVIGELSGRIILGDGETVGRGTGNQISLPQAGVAGRGRKEGRKEGTC